MNTPWMAVRDHDGTRHESFFVVDNFYDDPHEVREFALQLSYKRPLISSTPALISSSRHPAAKDALMRIGEIARTRPDWETVDDVYNFWGQAACGEFQLGLSHLNSPGSVHSHKNGEWVGVVYLSAPNQCKDRVGTYVLRHRELRVFRWHEIRDTQYEILKRDARDFSKWEVLAAPDMQFNRLFLFDSRYFHAESPGFGQSPADGRLVQIFNFKSTQ